jgi:putative membrane protein
MKRIITILLFLSVFTIAAAFSALNPTSTTVNFYLSEFNMPLSVIVVCAMLVGALITGLVFSLTTLRLRYENARLRKKLAVSEQEINSLRILPIKDAA